MASRFALLKHQSLGEGVVLHKMDSDIGRVCFAGNVGIKNILLSHHLVSQSDMDISQFIALGLYEAIFDEYTKNKAISYIDSFHIQNLQISPNLVEADVLGSESYHLTIEIKNSAIFFSCSCPVKGLCKHMYALCAYLANNNQNSHVKKISNQDRKRRYIRETLNNYFYYNYNLNVRELFAIYDNLLIQEEIKPFYDELCTYYRRNQYRNRVIELLYFLSLSDAIKNIFIISIENLENDEIKQMVDLGLNYPQNPNYFRYINNKSSRIKVALLSAVFKKDVDAFIHLERISDNESVIYASCLIKLLETIELNFEQIKQINHSDNFQRAHSYCYTFFTASKNIIGHNSALFIDFIDNVDAVLKQMPMEDVFLQYQASIYPLKFLSTFNDRFDEIEQEHYIDIVDGLIYGLLSGHRIKDDNQRSINSLVDKLPNNKYLKELIGSYSYRGWRYR